MHRVLQLLSHRWLVGPANISRLSSKLTRIRDLAIGPSVELASRNANFVESERFAGREVEGLMRGQGVSWGLARAPAIGLAMQ
jgi:hypothetical protein